MGVVFDEVLAEVEGPEAIAPSDTGTQPDEGTRTMRGELQRLRALRALDEARRARLEAD